jgi:CRP/FNR family transcriptional regulator
MWASRDFESPYPENPPGDFGASAERASPLSSHILQSVPTASTLFKPGDMRRLYRVEQGAVCHYIRWADGSHDVIEFAFPGDIIGLGKLGTHVSTAQAMVETVVSELDDADVERALESDHKLYLRLAAAGEREFEYLRDQALNAGRRSPVQRLAGYLAAASSMSGREGRDVAFVSNEISSGFVAERLKMDIATLEAALLSLKKQGLIEPTADGGLRLTDVAALEALADDAAVA